MEQPNERYLALARKWLNGTITEEEKKEMAEWLNQDPAGPVEVPPSFAQSEEELRQRMFASILQRRQHPAKVVPLYRNRFLHIAAAVLALVIGSFLFYRLLSAHNAVSNTAKQETIFRKEDSTAKKAITPGGNRAVLLLADGSEIVLDAAANGTIANEGATKVIKLTDGQLRLSSDGKAAATGYHTLATPRGGQYAITLADGTNVWLNAASSLRFPNAFTGPERTVELTGEAYFEVAKNTRQPFQVKVNGVEVNVLGTHFNIMAYSDEETIQTTLLEGAVRVQNGNSTSLLKPGQQAAVQQNGRIRVRDNADLEQIMAWKNGLFHFEGTRIETIMRQLARWYAIEVVYAGSVSDHFTGTISKQVGIEKVFQMLELTGAVHFTIDGDRVLVQP